MSRDFQPVWNIDRVYDMIREIGEGIPDRLPGSAAAERMANFSCEGFRQAGVSAEVLPVDALVSTPKPAVLKLLAPREQEISALTMAHSPSTTTPVEGSLVDVGLGSWEDYDGRDATGQVTLSELSYAPPRQEKQRIAGAMGSSAQIMMNWGYPDSSELPMGSVKSVWGNPTRDSLSMGEASVPCMGISRKDGLTLRELCAAGPVRVRLETLADTGWRKIHVTVGELPGPEGDDFVLVGGHQDGWFGAAATDNAAGSAIAIELARVFTANQDAMKRGLVFGLWAGHETGTMAGSSWWADRNWDRLRDHAVAYLQIDQPACLGTTGWAVTSNFELRRLAEEVHQARGEGSALDWALQVKNGDSSFFGVGVPIMVAHSHFPPETLETMANAAYGWWHHTDKNGVDKVDKGLLAKHLDTYAAYLKRLTMDPILPLRYAGLGEAIEQRLAELSALAGDDGLNLASLHRDAVQLKEKLSALDRRADTLNASGSDDQGTLTVVNDALKGISRTLIPAVSTAIGKYGHDVYGLTEQTTLLPGLYYLGDYLASNEAAEREMRWVELIRARNRISDAVSASTALAGGALAGL